MAVINDKKDGVNELLEKGYTENASVSFHDKIVLLQSKATVKKEKHQGVNFYSRSSEMIFETVKPVLKELSLILTFENSILEIGGELFVQSVATIRDKDNNEIKGTSLALIPRATFKTMKYDIVDQYKIKKEVSEVVSNNRLHGQQDPQVTGSCNSYANKYALQNLLCIDENVDIDQDYKVSGYKNNNNNYQQKPNQNKFNNSKITVDNSETIKIYSQAINGANKIKTKLQDGEVLNDKENEWFVSQCSINISDFESDDMIDFSNELIKFYQNKLNELKG
ncbi:MAG: ERF family protein [Chitinophagaceae bacterium]